MNTQTHLLVAAALLARPQAPVRNVAALCGGLLPDASIYVMYGVAKLQAVPEAEIWSRLYFTPFWHAWIAATNSVPIYGALLIAGLARGWEAAAVFALAALSHIAFDLPLHREDAHPHFWPVSDWTFVSPVSYWDPNHYGYWSAAFEVALALALVAVLWRRFAAGWVRALLLLALVPYLLVPLHFKMALGG